MRHLLIGIGELLWDILPGGEELGGAPANFSYHAQSLGERGVIVSCIGADDYGRQVVDQLNKLSLGVEYIAVDETRPTGTVSIQVDAEGRPFYTIREDVAWDFIPETSELVELARRADAVCFGTLAQRNEVSRFTIQAFLREMSAHALRIFDINLRQSFYSLDVIEKSLDLAHVFKLNEEELTIVSKLLSLDAGDESTLLLNLSRQHNLRMVALTRGERGSILCSQGRISSHAGYKTEVVDTVGAGDAFAAALAVGMLRGKDLDSINSDANRAAAYVCSKPGAMPELPAGLRNMLSFVDKEKAHGFPYKTPGNRRVRFGSFRSLRPITHSFGFDGGLCVDRYYIENFLSQRAEDIRGHVLEIGDDVYTCSLGGERVTKSDVLHTEEGNPKATIVADLTRAGHLPSNTFDCVICTQTLQYIYDGRSAVRTLHRILKAGGVVLATLPTIAHISRYDMESWGEYWRFTSMGAERLFSEAFPNSSVKVQAYGNVLTAMAFLHGLPADRLTREELDYRDLDYEVLVAVRAVKPKVRAPHWRKIRI